MFFVAGRHFRALEPSGRRAAGSGLASCKEPSGRHPQERHFRTLRASAVSSKLGLPRHFLPASSRAGPTARFSFASTSGGDPLEKKTYYDILEITRRAKPEDVKAAYRRLAKKYHPDKNPDDEDAERRFIEVQAAHLTLKDKWKRALYDQDLQFGSMATQEVDTEKWKENFDKETPEEREARKERYRRYARGERNDLPYDPWFLKLTPLLFIAVIGGVYYICIRAPDWIDGQSDSTFCDPAFDDATVPLVRAFHNPVTERWERLPAGVEAPRPKVLYEYYQRSRPDVWIEVDPRKLPRVALTALPMPRTDTVRATAWLQAAVPQTS